MPGQQGPSCLRGGCLGLLTSGLRPGSVMLATSCTWWSMRTWGFWGGWDPQFCSRACKSKELRPANWLDRLRALCSSASAVMVLHPFESQ